MQLELVVSVRERNAFTKQEIATLHKHARVGQHAQVLFCFVQIYYGYGRKKTHYPTNITPPATVHSKRDIKRYFEYSGFPGPCRVIHGWPIFIYFSTGVWFLATTPTTMKYTIFSCVSLFCSCILFVCTSSFRKPTSMCAIQFNNTAISYA